jgi:TerD domain
VINSGDNRTGDGAGDDETITVKLGKLPPSVMYVAFLINVYNRPNLQDVRSCTARVYHGSKKEKFRNSTLMELPISKSSQFDTCRGLFVFVLVRNDAWWSVHAVGVPAMSVTFLCSGNFGCLPFIFNLCSSGCRGGNVIESVSVPGSVSFLRGFPSAPVRYLGGTVTVLGVRGLAPIDKPTSSAVVPRALLRYRKFKKTTNLAQSVPTADGGYECVPSLCVLWHWGFGVLWF